MASGLYTSLTASQVQDYYAKNKPTRGGIYTDHLIYSPGVPVIRHEETNELLATPYCVNLITMPAVNANVARKQTTCEEEIEKIMKHRADCVLSVAAEECEKFLVLGAWGCGVFGNHPTFVAETFRHLLVGNEANFGNVFTRIVFAVLDRTKDEAKLNAFKRTFQKI